MTHQLKATVFKDPTKVKTKCGLTSTKSSLSVTIWRSEVDCPKCLHKDDPVDLFEFLDALSF